MSAEETEDCLVHPDTRTIKQVTVEDIKATDLLFDTLMGSAAAPRKKFIQQHSEEATYGI
jgi:DNA gyrase subunit B